MLYRFIHDINLPEDQANGVELVSRGSIIRRISIIRRYAIFPLFYANFNIQFGLHILHDNGCNTFLRRKT